MSSAFPSTTGAGNYSGDFSNCTACRAKLSESLRNCPSCGIDAGCPNVRAANQRVELEALLKRFEQARDQAGKRGQDSEFHELQGLVAKSSCVVIAIRPEIAIQILKDDRLLYANYERLVGAEVRVPASPDDDSIRYAVAGKLFGSYANKIHYGVLSLDSEGVLNYGRVFLKLRDESVKYRTSFLHENSYSFVKKHNKSIFDAVPRGYRSGWSNRDQLACAKLEPALRSNMSQADYAHLLLVQGGERSKDDFIEAHIYGPFNAESIDSIICKTSGASRRDNSDMRIIIELMNKITAKRGVI